MRNGKFFIIVGIMFAGLAWLLDTFVDWLFYSGGTFWEALITDVPAHEVYIRSITVAVVVVFGILVSAATSKQRQAERKAAESERSLQELFDAIQYGISVRDRELNLVRTNKWEERKYASQMPLVGKKCYRVFQQRSSPCPWCPSVKAMETGKPHSAVVPYPSEENPTGWIELSAFPLWDAEGNVVGAIEHAKDITARKQAEQKVADNERFLQRVFDSIQDAISVRDCQLNVVRTNRWVEKKYASEMPLVGRKCYEVFQKRSSVCPWCPSARAMETGEPHRAIVPYPSAENPTGWFELSAFPLEDAEGNVIGVIEHGKEITERRRAERELHESREKYQSIFEHSPEMIVLMDLQGTLLDANQKAEELSGYGRDELVGMHFSQLPFWTEETKPRLAETFSRRLRGERIPPYELEFTRRDGDTMTCRVQGALLADAEGAATGVLMILSDVTEQRQAEEALRESEEEFRNVFQSSPLGIHMYELQPDGRLIFVDANPAADRILGVDNRQFVGKTLEEAFPSAAGTELPEKYRAAARDGTPYTWEQSSYQDGRVQGTFEVHAFQTSPGRMAAKFSDISDRKRTQEALRESEAKFRGLAERSFDMIFITDLEGHFTYVSPAAKRIVHFEPEEMVGRHFSDFLAPSDVPRALELFTRRVHGEEIDVFPLEGVRKDGRPVFVEVNSWPVMEDDAIVAIQGIIRDTTERRQAEERLRRMEAQLAHVARLSTLGELVAGIAHEVSQPLYCVVNFAKATRNVLTAEGEPNLKDLREWNEEIGLAARRAGQIITRLRDFVRRRELQQARVRINQVVRESVELVAFEARRRGVAVRLDLSPEPVMAEADRVQIQQVLVNLLRNAYEALEGVPTGQRNVAVRTAVVEPCVEVSVADSGPGPPDDALKIFDAFVTTKPDGLGMGLAISRTIVEAHRGRLWAIPNRDRGTTFRFTLPLGTEGPSDGGQADGLRR